MEVIVKALDSKRAEDIQVLRVQDLTILGDYFIIANGTSTTHTRTLAERIAGVSARSILHFRQVES